MKKLIFVSLIFTLSLLGETDLEKAKVYYENEKYQKAVELLISYVEKPITTIEISKARDLLSKTYVKLGNSYFNKKEYEKAQKFYYSANNSDGDKGYEKCEKIISVKRFEIQAKNNITFTQEALKNGDYDRVKDDFNKYKKTEVNYKYRNLAEQAYIQEAKIEVKQDNYRTALDILKEAEQVLIKTSETFQNFFTEFRGELAGKIEPETFEEAREIYGTSSNLCYYLAKDIQYNKGKHCEFYSTIEQVMPGMGFITSSETRTGHYKAYCLCKDTYGLVDDVNVKGIAKLVGTTSYETVSGGIKTVPKLEIVYLEELNCNECPDDIRAILSCPKKCNGGTYEYIGSVFQVLPGLGFFLKFNTVDDFRLVYCVYPNTENLYDGMSVSGKAQLSGTYRYETSGGYYKTVPKIEIKSMENRSRN